MKPNKVDIAGRLGRAAQNAANQAGAAAGNYGTSRLGISNSPAQASSPANLPEQPPASLSVEQPVQTEHHLIADAPPVAAPPAAATPIVAAPEATSLGRSELDRILDESAAAVDPLVDSLPGRAPEQDLLSMPAPHRALHDDPEHLRLIEEMALVGRANSLTNTPARPRLASAPAQQIETPASKAVPKLFGSPKARIVLGLAVAILAIVVVRWLVTDKSPVPQQASANAPASNNPTIPPPRKPRPGEVIARTPAPKLAPAADDPSEDSAEPAVRIKLPASQANLFENDVQLPPTIAASVAPTAVEAPSAPSPRVEDTIAPAPAVPTRQAAAPPAQAASAPASQPAKAVTKFRDCPPGMRLNGVINCPDGRRASINNRMVKVGGTVGGAKVISISEFSVEMELDGERFLLGIGIDVPESSDEEPAADQPPPPPAKKAPSEKASPTPTPAPDEPKEPAKPAARKARAAKTATPP